MQSNTGGQEAQRGRIPSRRWDQALHRRIAAAVIESRHFSGDMGSDGFSQRRRRSEFAA